ncbi:MAG: hypothetical protein NTZ01_01165 [Verrucomicrobia bacterium]|nr:hypothetical protein [Verrucomicrobiota bacterium]
MHDPDALFGTGVGLAKVIGELEVGGFFRFRFTGDAQEVGGFIDN